MRNIINGYASQTKAFGEGLQSPRTVLEEHLEIIERREPEIRAFVCVDVETARAEADRATARWREGQSLSPLDGLVFGVKDIIETEAFPTAQGAPMLEGDRTGRDSASVRALREAGAIVLGKTTTTEFASTELFSDTRNAHDSNRTPGGSSSGTAAAVGSWMLPLGLASQVVGSTLRPASYNGAVGYKPTAGGLNRGGSYDYLSQSCVGLIGATLEDVWISARAIAAHVGGDPGYVGVLGPDALPDPVRPGRVAVLHTDGWAVASSEVRAQFEGSVERLARTGTEIVDAGSDQTVAALEEALQDALEKTWRILVWEMQWPLNTYAGRPDISVSEAMRFRLSQGEAMSQGDYAHALEERVQARARLADAMKSCDAILTLGATGAAPRDLSTTGDPSFNVPASLLGAPAVSLPLLRDDDMPLGLQIIAGQQQDARLMQHAHGIAKLLTEDA